MLSRLRAHRANLIELAGFAAVVAGVALVYVPAALIVAGLCIVFIAQGVS